MYVTFGVVTVFVFLDKKLQGPVEIMVNPAAYPYFIKEVEVFRVMHCSVFLILYMMVATIA